jgi:phospholipid/cholesterol/gamma-HCH transport system substrate-binding protein
VRTPAGRRFAAFALTSVLLTAWIGSQITGSTPGGAYTLHASFDDVAGLRDGDDVRLAGIPIGRVRSIKVVDGRAVVELDVDPSVRVAEDATVAVRWRNLIGQRYLAIQPGDSTVILVDGSEITHVEDVVDLGRLVNQLAPLAQSVGPDQINRVLDALVTAFEGNDGAFDLLVDDMADLTAALGQRQALVDQLLADSATVSDALASRDQQIAAMVSNVAAITGAVESTDQLLARSVDELSQFTTTASGVLTRSQADLGAVVEFVSQLTGTAVADLDTIEEAIQTLPPMLDAVLPTINRGPFLRVNLLCLATGPGACPHPLLFFDDEGNN